VHYDDTQPAGAAEVVETGEVMVFLGDNFVITVRHGEHGGLHAVRKRLESDAELLRLGPSAVLHAVMDSIVDSYVVVCRALQEDVDEAETAVFTESSRITDSNVIYVLKREVLELRRATAPLAPVLHHLSHGSVTHVHPNVRDYFRDVDDHLSEVVDRVNGFDDLLTTLVSANLARVSVVQNEDMRKISAWAAIALVPTAIAGIYGMNFEHMPELGWRFGYPAAILLIIGICGLLYYALRRKRWL
jgi:magnesium transporter